MELKTTIEHDGIEREIDLTELDRYGAYYVDHENGLIVNAPVYTQGTPDSRFIRGEVVCGTDFEFEPVEVDREAVQEQIREEFNTELTDSELDRVVRNYREAGVMEIARFDDMLVGYEILRRANHGVVSTDVEVPLAGWDKIFGEAHDRAFSQAKTDSQRDVLNRLFKALQESSAGSYMYSARIKLTD